MKFITEDELRRSWRGEHPGRYRLAEGMRLTPGARQFLIDCGVTIQNDPTYRAGAREVPAGTDAPVSPETGLPAAARLISACFLKSGWALMTQDVLIAEEVFELQRQLVSMFDSCPDQERQPPAPCTGIPVESAGDWLDDCFEVTAFHAMTSHGGVIVELHYLRCLLRDLETDLPEARKQMNHRMINRLSQLICKALGGTECQRKK